MRFGGSAVDFVAIEGFHHLVASAQGFAVGLVSTEEADGFGVLHPDKGVAVAGGGEGKLFVGQRAGLGGGHVSAVGCAGTTMSNGIIGTNSLIALLAFM